MASASGDGRERPLLLALVFGSGFCGLVYQVVWQREFRLIFGGSTAASAAVLAIFIGGLGFGAVFLGKRADRSPRPLLLYGRLEWLVAVWSALTPFLLDAVGTAYVALGGAASLGATGAAVVRLALSALVLLPACAAMGGTLPAAARAVTSSADAGRRGLARVYGTNTLGAVLGGFLPTFVLIESVGTRRTLWLAAIVNLVIAFAAVRAGRRALNQAPALLEVEEKEAGAPRGFILFAAAALGAVFFLMEVVWYRMLGPILGGTIFTFGLVLALVLFGIGTGSLLYVWREEYSRPTLGAFSATCLLQAAAVTAPLIAGDRLALLALRLQALGEHSGFWGDVAGWSLVAGLVVLPASSIAGYQFPLLIGLLGAGRKGIGRDVGLAYAFNTAGAVAGSLAGGFGLLPLLSAPGCWRLAAALLAGLGVAAASHQAYGRGLLRALAAPLGAGVVAGAAFASEGPTAVWRHSGIGARRADARALRAPGALRDWSNAMKRALVWQADGVESSVALLGSSGLAFAINGKIDGNARSDAPTAVGSGLLAALLHPSPTRALVVGLGVGSTAGWLAAAPALERVDVVELEPRILDVARSSAAVNAGALQNPKLRVAFGDARERLLASRELYDLIVSEPSNPYRAGVASLFTRDFYAAVEDRLGERGLFLQWMQAYEIDAATLDTVCATLLAVFPAVEIWQVGPGDLLFVASRQSMRHDAKHLRERLAREPWRAGFLAVWRAAGLEGVLARFVGGTQLTRARAARGVVNTDDRNRVEFGFARSVGRRELFELLQLRNAARASGADRPGVGGEVDWSRVRDERILMDTADGLFTPLPDELDAQQRSRAQAQRHFSKGEWGEALRAWRSQPREPESPLELALVAEACANAGNEASGRRYADALSAYQPVEADAVLARLHLQGGRLEEAARSLEAAFERARVDPWPTTAILWRALLLSSELARRDAGLARRMRRALERPFAVLHLEEQRRRTLLRIAAALPAHEVCQASLALLEPHVPWELEVLLYRRNCYAETGDRLLGVAATELAQFAATARPGSAPLGFPSPPAVLPDFAR